MKVLMRADASLHIGSGHVVRCLTLATALRGLGAEVSFACRRLPGALLQSIAAEGWPVYELPEAAPVDLPDIQAPLPWQADIDALAEQLPSASWFDWLVVDHYGLDQRWEHAARQWAAHIMVIDDLANRCHGADLLLDQNFNATPQRYAPWLAAPCRSLLGPRYALLRDEFRCTARPVAPVVAQVLVNFGGMDAAGQTLKAVRALLGFPGLQVTVVAGRCNPDGATLQALLANRPGWVLLEHSTTFAQLMAKADLFIGAGGGTSWERAALGLPTICLAVAANQQANAQALAAAGVQCYLGPGEQVTVASLGEAIAALLADAPRRQHYAQRSRQLVDGLGAQRVAVAMAEPALHLRAVTREDAQLLFDGRNAEQVRRWSGQSAPLDWQAHGRWLDASLVNPQRQLLLASVADGPVGVLRYDRSGERAEVSIYLFAGRFGLGWGRILLAQGEAFITTLWPGLRWLDAQVLPGNQASINLFLEAGYGQHGEWFARALMPRVQGVVTPPTCKEQP